MVLNGRIILYPRMATNYVSGYAFSYEYGQFGILNIQIRMLLDSCARGGPNFAVSGTHDTKIYVVQKWLLSVLGQLILYACVTD